MPYPAVLAISALLLAQTDSPARTLLADLAWRPIGPAIMGGRIDDIAVVESDPRIYYVATAASGIFKTTNNGTTFTSIFDNQATGSIGDIAIAPSNPDVVYVGTGEANNRQSSTWGNGVYKSTDGGKTWSHLGLEKTHHIARIVVHPTNPDVAYVAAVGRLWGASPERGLYKTVDGGKTWSLVLSIDADTGVTDVVMDPTQPDTLLAATYQRRRTPFSFAGGGPGSGLHKTSDGGKTWKKLSGGLPTTELGRIGIDLCRSKPNVIYATVESVNSGSTQSPGGNGGLWRSDDGGESWTRTADMNPRPMYFSQVRVDPKNEQNVWVLGVSMYFSRDGGKTFRREDTPVKVHADGHALWIDPTNPQHLLLGCDGGLQASYDNGRTWDYHNTIPISQFYEVHFDFRMPYFVYGGLQDNGTWGAPSQSLDPSLGVTNDHWFNVGGGDGFHARVDPTDPSVLYVESQNGAVRRVNPITGEARSIRPRQTDDEAYRFDWNTPIEISPHDPKKILLGGNRLFLSTDRGDTWRRTDDLTTKPDRNKMPIMGRLVTNKTLSAHDGESTFGEIVAVAESPVTAGVLWVGTDDGNLQLSQDDGATWTNVIGRLPGAPKGAHVARVTPSRFAAGRCYVALDNHRNDDFAAYLYVTEDFGQTWRALGAGIGPDNFLHVVREHPRAENLLFVGAERGLFVSFDRGAHWEKFGAPLPTVPVNDLQIHPRDNDLILATHGRGIYILNDLGPFELLARGELSGPMSLAPPRPGVQYRTSARKGITGDKIYVAPEISPDTSVRFHLASNIDPSTLRLEVLDRGGKIVRTLRAPRLAPGWNRVAWDLRADGGVPTPTVTPPQPEGETENPLGGFGGGQGGGFGQGGGRGGFGGQNGPRGPRVLPGAYTVRLTVGGQSQTRPVAVADDPRVTLADKDRAALFAAQSRLVQLWRDADAARRSVDTLLRRLADARDEKPETLGAEVKALETKASAVRATIAPTPVRRGAPRPTTPAPTQPPSEGPNFAEIQRQQAAALTGRITLLIQSLDSIAEPLTPGRKAEIKALEAGVRRALAEAAALTGRDLKTLNDHRKAAGLPAIQVVVPPVGGPEEEQE